MCGTQQFVFILMHALQQTRIFIPVLQGKVGAVSKKNTHSKVEWIIELKPGTDTWNANFEDANNNRFSRINHLPVTIWVFNLQISFPLWRSTAFTIHELWKLLNARKLRPLRARRGLSFLSVRRLCLLTQISNDLSDVKLILLGRPRAY